MNKLALKRAKDWRQRVQFLTDNILGHRPGQFVAEVLDRRLVQMTPTDYCFVVKWVGASNWGAGVGGVRVVEVAALALSQSQDAGHHFGYAGEGQQGDLGRGDIRQGGEQCR